MVNTDILDSHGDPGIPQVATIAVGKDRDAGVCATVLSRQIRIITCPVSVGIASAWWYSPRQHGSRPISGRGEGAHTSHSDEKKRFLKGQTR